MILKNYLLKCGLLVVILNVSWGAGALPSFDSRHPVSEDLKMPIVRRVALDGEKVDGLGAIIDDTQLVGASNSSGFLENVLLPESVVRETVSGEPAEPCIIGPDVLENEAGASSVTGRRNSEESGVGESVVERLLLVISDSKEAAAVRAVLEDLSALNRRGVRDFAIKGFRSIFKSEGIASSDRLIAAKALFELEAYDEGIAAFEELLCKDGRAILEAKELAERIEAFLCFDSWSFRENEAQEKALKKLKKYYNGFEAYAISQDEKEASKKAVSRLVECLEDVAQQNMSIKRVGMWFDSVAADMDLLSGLGSGVFLH